MVAPHQDQLGLWPVEESDQRAFLPEDYLVMSLQEEPWGRIASGIKRYEYRHRFRLRPSVVFIYVTVPTARIEGVLVLGSPIVGTAREIGDLAERHIPGNGEAVFEYFAPKDRGMAIPIAGVKLLDPVPLRWARETYDFLPPQSYMALYKKPELFAFLLSRAGIDDIGDPLRFGFTD